MSHFHFGIKTGKRGSSAEHLAYITRTGNHSKREDLVATGYGNMPEWSEDDPMLFFKSAEKYERKNAGAYIDITFSLPKELSNEQNVVLARQAVEELAGPKPFLLAVHAPASSLEGESNPHAHAMISARVPDGINRPPEQMFRRYNAKHPESGGRRKDSGGMNRIQLANHARNQRRIIADTTNEALTQLGHTTRVDPRTLREQGKRRSPERHLGPARIRSMSDAEKKEYVLIRHKEQQADE